MASHIYVDHSHLNRTVTGLERITLELFSEGSLAPLHLEAVTGDGSTRRMMLTQQLRLPAKLVRDRSALILCPGFPPSVPLVLAGGRRVIPYIHDCFLLTRPQDLNWRARVYMAPAFRFALARLPWFLVNSESTRDELRRFCRTDAEISLYRPVVRDVFGVAEQSGSVTRSLVPGGKLDIIAVGTIEPRKNLAAAAMIVDALRRLCGFDACLHLVGRPGWGGEAERLAQLPGVTVHGYQPAERVRELLMQSHLLLSTSHDEGLGLPLIEAQYAGLPVAAPDKPVFREVLGASGLLLDTADADGSARRIADVLGQTDAFPAARQLALANVERWNSAAAADRLRLIERLAAL